MEIAQELADAAMAASEEGIRAAMKVSQRAVEAAAEAARRADEAAEQAVQRAAEANARRRICHQRAGPRLHRGVALLVRAAGSCAG
jgi:Xaa-Pro aminopeptidase